MKVSIQTLGCKVNQYESQAMELLLRQRGHEIAGAADEADAYIINSCTVTATSDKKSRQAVRQARGKHPAAVVALCGCYPQVSGEEAAALDVDLLGGSAQRVQFVENLERIWQERQRIVSLDTPFERRAFERLPAGGLSARTRAMLKVEDGCTNFCSFCIIPYARGPVRSLPLDEAVEQARGLAAQGYREIVLTGIELSSWGRDLEQAPPLQTLIAAVCRAVPDCRVRLGSLEPRTVTEEFCRALETYPNLCAHFHLSLQSGCDETLKRMGRRYDTARYLQSVQLLRAHWDAPGITTDLIAGFPGETAAEFEQTLAFIERCAFSDMHIFPYSRREGTAAAHMAGQIPNAEKARRAKAAGALAEQMRAAYLGALVGKTRSVLFETQQGEFWHGHTPEYVSVLAKGTALHNEIRSVGMTAVEGPLLRAVIVETEEERP